MVYAKVHLTHLSHPQDIQKSPRGAQALGIDFGWGEQQDLEEEGDGSTSVFFLPWIICWC